MISFEEALRAVLDQSRPLPSQQVGLRHALGCVLAEPLTADCDWPIFDNSAVDGFGVRIADMQTASPESPARLRLVGTIQAGADPQGVALPAGSTWRILTGAAVPSTVEAVVMKEHAEVSGGTVALRHHPHPGENIRRRAGEFAAGTRLLEPGVRITPPVVGLMAALGRTACTVHGRPAAALICTGDELVPPGQPLKPGQIYDSNACALAAALDVLGVQTAVSSRVPDDPATLERIVAEHLASADVLITVGGVSVGEYDFVKDVMAALGVQTVFWGVAIKPGKPNYFGTYPAAKSRSDSTSTAAATGAATGTGAARATALQQTKLVFGLPGNPVSALCSFHQLVRPALRRMMGLAAGAAPTTITATLDADLTQRPGRLDFVRGRLRFEDGRWHVSPVRGQGSHMIAGLAAADCLIHLPAETARIERGAPVLVEPLDW